MWNNKGIFKTGSFCLGLLFILSHQAAWAAAYPDSTEGKLRVSADFHYGFVMAHRPLLVPLQKSHVIGFDLQVTQPTFGKADWEKTYLFPQMGLNYSYFNLGDAEHLGHGHTLYPFVLFPVNKNPNFQFNIRFGAGIGYIDKTFNRLENYKNQAISTHGNAIFDVHGALYWKITSRTFMQAAFGITHFSNGSIGIPNIGINIASLNGGVSYYFGKKEKIDWSPPGALKVKLWRGSVMLTGSYKKVYPPGSPPYLASSLSILESIRVKKKSAFGLALDIFYDNSIHPRLKQLGESYGGLTDQIRVGLAGSYELIVSDLSLLLQVGGYLHTKLKTDGSVYSRFGIRYSVSKNYFLCFNLKTHFAKADFFEFGGGVKF